MFKDAPLSTLTIDVGEVLKHDYVPLARDISLLDHGLNSRKLCMTIFVHRRDD